MAPPVAIAGIVILLARPFNVGDHIRVRSGPLGGELDGIVLGMSVTYVTLHSDGGPLKVPNSTLIAAAVGPYIRRSSSRDAPSARSHAARRKLRGDDRR